MLGKLELYCQLGAGLVRLPLSLFCELFWLGVAGEVGGVDDFFGFLPDDKGFSDTCSHRWRVRLLMCGNITYFRVYLCYLILFDDNL